MSTQLPVKYEEVTEEELRAASGQVVRNSFPWPRLIINREAENDDGDALVVGAYTLFLEGVGRIYSKNAKFRALLNCFQYSIYSLEERTITSRTILFHDWREEILDTDGGMKCGKVTGKRNKDALSTEEAEQQKKIKCQRHLFGLVSMTGTTAKGEEVKVESVPCLWRTGGVNFMPIGDALEELTKANLPFWTHWFDLTTKREKNDGNTYYAVAIALDKQAKMSLSEVDFETLKGFRSYVNSENDTVEVLHQKAMARDVFDAQYEELSDTVDAVGIVRDSMDDDISDL